MFEGFRNYSQGGFARVFYSRITLLEQTMLPATGPVLYVGTHRNGAVDGFVYRAALGPMTFLISKQLRRSFCGRLFFNGIEVARSKDRESGEGNELAMEKCLEHLKQGGRLFIFPEGTSDLGPRHLPFKAGAAWLIKTYLERGGTDLSVIPAAVHYERAWAFRSKVEVVTGKPIRLEVEGSEFKKLKEFRSRIQNALEEIGVNVPSAEYQAQIEQIAYAATLATPLSYFSCLKALEKGIPEPITDQYTGLEQQLQGKTLLRHQGIPLVPMHPWLLYFALWLPLAAIIAVGALLNLPPLVAGWFAGKRFPDGINVVALWKALVGIPLLVIWFILATITLGIIAGGIGALAYAALTVAAILGYYRAKKLTVAVVNGARYPELKEALLSYRETIISNLKPKETALREEVNA